jgi:hypothetical protein
VSNFTTLQKILATVLTLWGAIEQDEEQAYGDSTNTKESIDACQRRSIVPPLQYFFGLVYEKVNYTDFNGKITVP